ncbi:glycerol-3-phosphate phosphatase [Musca vetustissima]|uniref:glycerol-3-phosphate phosphatase n=1 Tax=Musca vetustissima TaxID=27455 RepID=UPI002AB7281E|nr:glycerol-3-phosphate phosphatase [Musca vetustissima]
MPITINLNEINDQELTKNWLDLYDTIFTDCDSVLWQDNSVIAGAPETINALQNLGKRVYFVTNNSTKTRSELCVKARGMGFQVTEEQIIAPSYTIAEYLKLNLNSEQKVYLIGSPAMAKELDSLGIEHFGLGEDIVEPNWASILPDIDEQTRRENIGAVLIGFDEHFSYNKMIKAANFLVQNDECLFLATNVDAVSKFPKYSVPGTGAILRGIEACVGREAVVMGKPNPVVCEQLLRAENIKPERSLMIGDCHKADVLFGKNCGFATMLVGTGRYKWSDVLELQKNDSKQYIPDFYASSLADLRTYL